MIYIYISIVPLLFGQITVAVPVASLPSRDRSDEVTHLRSCAAVDGKCPCQYHLRNHICISIYIYIYIHTPYIYIYTYIYIYRYIYIYMYIPIHI